MLAVSGGMEMSVPCVKIGVQIGTIKILDLIALVVDDGYHQILFGSDLFNRAFSVGEKDEENISVNTPWKEDVSALSLELYQIEVPFDIIKFESYLSAQRKIYNLLIVLEFDIAFETVDALRLAIESDVGLPRDVILQLSAVASGSIWIGIKSGALATLRKLASIFDTSATARLAQQMAEAKKAETQAGISEDTRNATASHIIAEQEMLKAENIRKTYDTWRREVEARIKFIDKMIAQVADDSMRNELIRQKDNAIFELANQNLLPMVRNIPRPYEPGEGVLLIQGPRIS